MASKVPRGKQAFELERAQLDAEQAVFFDRVSSGPRGRVPINLRAWMHNMPFAKAVEPFGLYVSETAPISKREKEITVLVNARCWNATFEWEMHRRHGLRVGLTEAQIEAIGKGQDPGFEDRGEACTWRLAHHLHAEKRVPDDFYQTVLAEFGHKWVSDRIGLIGLYTMIAFTLNFYDVEPPAPEQATHS